MVIDANSQSWNVARNKYKLGGELFSQGRFSDAAKVYMESGKIYSELGSENQVFMAYFQALMARSKQYPKFFTKESEDFLEPQYLRELEEFVTNFSGIEQGEERSYKEKYVKTKYKYLQANGYKCEHKNDIESESNAFLELANFLEEHADVFSGKRYRETVFRYRMMAEQAEVKLLKAKGYSLEVLAEECKRIADMGEPPAESTSPFLEEAKAQQANFYAASFKFSAFSKLEKRTPSISDVKAAMEYMEHAFDQAKIAKVWFDQIDVGKGHRYEEELHYLSYWYNVFRLRVSVVEKEFDEAQAALETALSDARYYEDLKRKSDIFPNYYADFNDLQNEALIISASRALVIDRDAGKSEVFLKQWVDRSKDGGQFGSWRFNNVYIRYLVVSLLALLPSFNKNRDVCKNKMKEIEDIVKDGFVGSASRNLATIAKDIVKYASKKDIYDTLFNNICDLFPIDSRTSDFRITEPGRESLDPFQLLPEYFSTYLKKPENLNKLPPDQIQETNQNLMEGLRSYLLFITEFHYKRYLLFKLQGLPELAELPDTFVCRFSEMDVNRLKISLGEICKALNKNGNRFRKFQFAFRHVEDLLPNNTQSLVTVESLEKSFQVVLEKVIPNTYKDFFPHVVQFTKSWSEYETNIYQVKRIWKKGVPEVLNLFGSGLTLGLEESAYYYLTPSWKKYGRASADIKSSEFDIFKSDLYSDTVEKEEKEQANYRDDLKQKLLACPSGEENRQVYEEICTEILNSVFVPPLGQVMIQPKVGDGPTRRHALSRNEVSQGFWNRIWEKFGSEFIFFEFENTENLEPHHVNEVDTYLRKNQHKVGKFGVILSRKTPSQIVLTTRNTYYGRDEFLILFLDNHLLVEALKLKEAGEDPDEVFKNVYDEFLISYKPVEAVVPAQSLGRGSPLQTILAINDVSKDGEDSKVRPTDGKMKERE